MRSAKVSTVCILIILLLASSAFCQSLEDRVLEFVTNMYSGKYMNPEEWLTKKGHTDKYFHDFGGLKALVEYSSRDAKEAGGLESVKILYIKKVQDGFEVHAEVIFRNKEKRTDNMGYWELEVGKWMSSPSPLDNRKPAP